MRELVRQIGEAVAWFREAAARLSVRRESGPIADVDGLFHFVRTRSALVSQKKLYGYLKERMGISYPKMFEDEAMARSIDVAKMHVYAAALSDLTVHAVGHVAVAGLEPGAHRALAKACYLDGIEAFREQAPDDRAVREWRDAFDRRLDETLWENVVAGGSAFSASPKALIRWAPIADEHKRYDREIVENSIRFAWNEIREDMRNRLDPAAVAADWEGRAEEARR